MSYQGVLADIAAGAVIVIDGATAWIAMRAVPVNDLTA